MECPSCSRLVPSGARFCMACGQSILPGQALLEQAGFGSSSEDGESETRATGGRPSFRRASYRLATLGDRLIALVLDAVVLLSLFAVVGTWAAVRWGGVTENGLFISGQPFALTVFLTTLAGFLYFWVSEAVLNATLGKAIVGLEVRTAAGEHNNYRASALRNLLRVVDSVAFYVVGFLVATFSRLRQRVGDHIAGTVVVEREVSELAQGGFVLLWLVLLGAAGWGVARVYQVAPVPAASAANPGNGILQVLRTPEGLVLEMPYLNARFGLSHRMPQMETAPAAKK